MQVDDNVGQVQQVKRIPILDQAPIDRRAMLKTLDDGPGAPRPVATGIPEVAVEPKRLSRRFGAGF